MSYVSAAFKNFFLSFYGPKPSGESPKTCPRGQRENSIIKKPFRRISRTDIPIAIFPSRDTLLR
jgi:hypothetical protein